MAAALLPRCAPLAVCQQRSFAASVPSTSAPRVAYWKPRLHDSRASMQRCRSGFGELDPMESLSRSAIFQSDVVRAEFTKLMQDLGSLRAISKNFPEFDLEGKRIYLDQMEQAASRYEVFIKRLELSQDPAAKEYLRGTNAQMLNAGFSLQMMFDGLKQTIDMYRQAVQAEEMAIADPILHQKFKQELRATWHGSGMNFLDIGDISPEIVWKAQKDPEFWKAIKEIKTDPSKMAAWMQHPSIGPLVKEMMNAYMKQQGL